MELACEFSSAFVFNEHARFILTKLVVWLIKKALFRKRSSEFDHGNAYAIFQIVKYVVWVIAIALILDTAGIKLTVLLAGSAALLVGIGLGLQQTLNDIISGIILLSERSIKVDDILELVNIILGVHSLFIPQSTVSQKTQGGDNPVNRFQRDSRLRNGAPMFRRHICRNWQWLLGRQTFCCHQK